MLTSSCSAKRYPPIRCLDTPPASFRRLSLCPAPRNCCESRAILLDDRLVKSVILSYAHYLLREFMVRLRPMLGYFPTIWPSTGTVNCPDHHTLANVLHFGYHAAAAVAPAIMLSCSSRSMSSTTYGVMKYFLVFW